MSSLKPHKFYQTSLKMFDNKKKFLILLSGGLDSTIITYWMKKNDYNIEALYFDYSQGKTNGERESAISTAKKLDVKLQIIETPLLSASFYNITKGREDNVINQYGDVINMFIMTLVYAFKINFNYIIVGINFNDLKLIPFLTKKFFKTTENLLNFSKEKNFKILTPFIDIDKPNILEIGVNLRVPFRDTWSCSTNVRQQCGICSDCLTRRRAFKQIGILDPTEYEHQNLY